MSKPEQVTPHISSWPPVSSQTLYLTTDASWINQVTNTGMGFAIWTHTGTCIFAGFDRSNAASPEEAEAHALRRGLEAVENLGIRDVAALSNCQNLTQLLQQREILALPMGASIIAHDIAHISALFDDCQFHFISRQFNHVAHELAQLGRKYHPFGTSDPIGIKSLFSIMYVSQS